MANERIKMEVLEMVGGGQQPHPAGRSKWKVGGRVVHVRFVRKPAGGTEYGFNVNANTLDSSYELWICGSSQDYYLLPIEIVKEMYDHPEAYVDQRHPYLKVEKVNLANHLCRYARGGLKKDLSWYYRGQVTVEGTEAAPHTPPATVWTENLVRYALRKHRTRERRLRKLKIRDSMEQNDGRLRCEIPRCAIDFVARYGSLGTGFAHVHHNVPLASTDEPVNTQLDALTIVCPNCHAMIHRWMKLHPGETCDFGRLIVTA